MIFRQGEKPDPVERVRIADTQLEAYRYANWDPYNQLADGLQVASLEATAAGQHLWDSTERLQAYGVATWMGACRQTVGNTLLAIAESSSSDGAIPVDVAVMALAHYQEAEKWLQFREDVYADPSYEQSSTIDARITWPQPDVNTHVSSELMIGLKAIHDELIYIEHPIITNLVTNSPFIKTSFKYYKQRLAQEGAKIESRSHQLNQQWNSRLNPNIEPGKKIYNELTDLIEDVLEHGIHELMPISQDARYLAAVRRNRPKSVSDEPELSFDPSVLGLEHPKDTHSPSGRPFATEGILPSSPSHASHQEKPFTAATFLTDSAINRSDKPFDPTIFQSAPKSRTNATPRPLDPSIFLDALELKRRRQEIAQSARDKSE